MSGAIGGPPLVEEGGGAFSRGQSSASTLISSPEGPGFDSPCNYLTASCSASTPSSSSFCLKQPFDFPLPACMSSLSSKLPWLRRRAASAPWVLFVFVFFFLSFDGLAMGFTLKQHGTSAGPAHSSPASLSLFPGSAAPLSGVQTAAREAPALNLEEDESCIFTGTVPENIKLPVSTVQLEPSQWAEHVEDRLSLQETLKAYQTTATPGREREFMMSFKLPQNLAETGSAVLTLHKEWDGSGHEWRCSEHILRVTRLRDDHYLQGRNAASETEDVIDWHISTELVEYSRDLGSIVYGKGLAGQSLHLLFREVHEGCLSAFRTPTEGRGRGPMLTVETVDTTSEDAVYGEWEPFAPCRVSCVTRVNYQCRKRTCTPGKNDGAACKMELMVDKQPCSDPSVSEACTCSVINEEGACPPSSHCDESTANNVSCFCSGRFVREGVDTKTVCQPALANMTTLESDQQTQTSSTLIILWVIIGVFLFIVIVGCVFLLCVKRKPVRDEDLLTMNLDPQTGAPVPGTADLGASMFWGQAPTLPMGAPPGAPSMVGRGPYGPAAVGGGPLMGQGGGGPQMAVASPAMGYGMGAPPQQAVGAQRSPTYSPMPPGTRL